MLWKHRQLPNSCVFKQCTTVRSTAKKSKQLATVFAVVNAMNDY